MDEIDQKWMKTAIQQAKMALELDEVPIGCVITYNNQIIARSHNQVERLNDPTAHAEMIAITSATEAVGSKYLNKCNIYITMEPCFMCAGAIHWSRFRKVVFAAADPKKGFTKYKPSVLLDKVEIIGGVLEEEARLLINRFFLRKR
ncbi:nucleoside deaminase [Membranicola marinus]|uniref:tRNA-specific adenosine deaminase n=1 Tax=Membranihabitans marinus TaxID=1227546 RepID=A0A953HSA0_9BACT|nr:nucleoside deaminase [Membranihabitans marinus]MBY5957336.1 nucleoside deaminase [Membranihabitans marinus]